MQETVKFNVGQTVKIKDETIRGILLNFNVLQSDGNTVCNIGDLRNISIALKYYKQGRKDPLIIYDGDLEAFLIGLYAQTPRFHMAKEKLDRGYQVELNFLPKVLQIGKHEELQVELFIRNTAFTSLSAPNSSVVLETIPAPRAAKSTWVPQIKTEFIGDGKKQIDFDIENNVYKVVAVTDFTNDYANSNKAKIERYQITADGYELNASESLLLSQNRNYLDFNPDTPVDDAVLYWELETLKNAKLRANFDKPVDGEAMIITQHKLFV